MRKVRRHHTRPKPLQHLLIPSYHYPDETSGIDTLTKRFRALQDGDSLYPWAHTVLQIRNGTRRWIAKPHD